MYDLDDFFIMIFKLGARRPWWYPNKSALKSLKMRELPIFPKSRYLENHMGQSGYFETTLYTLRGGVINKIHL